MIPIIPFRRTPFEKEVYLKADFSSKSLCVYVQFKLVSPDHYSSFDGGIATYDGHKWSNSELPGNEKISAVLISKITMLKIWHEGWETHKSRPEVETDSFWKKFVDDIEEAWPIFVTMEQ